MRRALYFLGILDDQDVEWMMRRGHKVTLQPGEHLIRQGTPADSLYFVLDGCFVVYTSTAARVADLKAGEVVGEISFVDARPPSASVRAEVESRWAPFRGRYCRPSCSRTLALPRDSTSHSRSSSPTGCAQPREAWEQRA